MSSPPKAIGLDGAFTNEGLPLETDSPSAVAASSAEACNAGSARRVESDLSNLPPPSSPPIVTSKTAPTPSEGKDCTRKSSPLSVGVSEGSLTEDDDEVIDYFGMIERRPSLETGAAPEVNGTIRSRWEVCEHNVPLLPCFYPLDKSSVFASEASASAIASGIDVVLRDRSIVASFDAQNAKVDCVSESKVEFRIRLYGYDQGIIAEVQRRWGFDVSYYQDVFAILDAVQNLDIQAIQKLEEKLDSVARPNKMPRHNSNKAPSPLKGNYPSAA